MDLRSKEDIKRTFSPLTPALSPLRGEGVCRRALLEIREPRCSRNSLAAAADTSKSVGPLPLPSLSPQRGDAGETPALPGD